MADRSAIEWTDASWNPIRARNLKTGKVGWHCEHSTTGCEFCYAEGFNKRLGTGLPFKPGHRKDIEIFLDEEMLLLPLHWKKPRMIFVCSMTDLFADFVTDESRDRMFAVMVLCPQHTFQVLTKRADVMRDYLTESRWDQIEIQAKDIALAHWKSPCIDHMVEDDLETIPLPNVWLGVSAERQQEADERIPLLLQTPAAVRFVSAEPLLGPISFRWAKWDNWCHPDGRGRRVVDEHDGLRMLDWIIVGGESGPHARPMHPQWAREIRDQCQAAGVSFFFKQWGEHGECEKRGSIYAIDPQRRNLMLYADGRHHVYHSDWDERDGVVLMQHVGKKAAGRLLDGVEHNGFPGATA